MTIKLIHQPVYSFICGQTCLAMILNISVEAACQIVGHNHCTSTGELSHSLDMCGFRNSGKLERIKGGNPLPNLCIIRSKVIGKRKGHWMVYSDGVEYDPFPVEYDKTIWKNISYLEIYND
jgi:hypothetical protein